nr:hypothetical protein [Tanacetum cinerariifolium]
RHGGGGNARCRHDRRGRCGADRHQDDPGSQAAVPGLGTAAPGRRIGDAGQGPRPIAGLATRRGTDQPDRLVRARLWRRH